MTARAQYQQWRNQQIVLYFTQGFSSKEIAFHMGMKRRLVDHIFSQCGITKKRTAQVYRHMEERLA